MLIKKTALLISLFLLSLMGVVCGAENYDVTFEGVDSKKLIELLESTSQAVKLKESPPETSAGVRRRAEADVINIVEALHSQAYYNAHVEVKYHFEGKTIVIYEIDLGPVYPLTSLRIEPVVESKTLFSYDDISPEDLGITLGEAATPGKILSAEKSLVNLMELNGYPFAKVTKLDVVADQKEKSLSVVMFIDSGPLTFFGPTQIIGNKRTKKRYFEQNIYWAEGDRYDPRKVQRTQNALEVNNLFRSVNISHPEDQQETHEIPMTVRVKESKQRSIGFGANLGFPLQELGPGISGEWEDRNITGMADRLSFKTSLWRKKAFGRLGYYRPDYLRPNENLVLLSEFEREVTEGYTMRSFSLYAGLQRQISSQANFSYGLKYEYLVNTNIHELEDQQKQKYSEERFDLFKAPLRLTYNNTDDLLDPSQGISFKAEAIPSYQFKGDNFMYCMNLVELGTYHSLDCNHRHVFAAQVTLGSIIGAAKYAIPRSELFDAGSESLMRGYPYKTVSPLDDEGDPIGGRSMMVYSFEYRLRTSKEWGWVLFYDVGNVYANRFPTLKEGVLQSAGIGARYYTPVGPIRLDVAFPLTPRQRINDGKYQVYLSIGQAF